MSSSMTSTLYLVLAARNETAAAFASVTTTMDRAGEHAKMMGEAGRTAGEHFRTMGEHLSHVAEVAAGFTLGAIGFSAISGAVGGIEDLGKSLIETNATAEQLTQTFAAIYHSGGEAQQAMGWLTQFAMNAPFTREAIQQAGVTIAALGLDITQVLPALGNLAGVMGTDMPTAAQAFMDAYEGRFQMMQRDLHVSKQQLQEYGLQIDANGKIVQNTLAPAFERFVAARYPNGMALQMETFNGQMSNLKDHLQLIERTAGGAMFGQLKTSLVTVIDYMNTHQSTILGLAAAFGQGLAGGMRAVGNVASWLLSVVPTALAVVEAVWGRLQGAIGVAGHAINLVEQGIGNYLGQVLVPAVETALGYIIQFWSEHGSQIVTILQGVANNVQHFLSFLASNFSSYLGILKGEWQVAWGVIETVGGGALDLISGNFTRFGTDLQAGWADIWDGATHIVEGAGEIMIRLVASSFDAINGIEHALYDNSQKIFGGLYDLFASLEEPIVRLTHAIFAPLMDGFNNVMDSLHNLSTSAVGQFLHMPKIPDLHMTMKSADQAISDLHKTARTDTHSLGWAPNQGITYDEKGAIARLQAMEKQIMAQNAVSNPGHRFSAQQAQKQGKDAFDVFVEQLKHLGAFKLTLPSGVDITALLGKDVFNLPVLGDGADGSDGGAGGKKGKQPGLASGLLGGSAQHTAGFGQSIISFAGAQQASDREQRRQDQAQILALQQTVANLTAQLAAKDRQTDVHKEAVKHAAATAESTRSLAAAANKPGQSLAALLRPHGVALHAR